MGLGRDLPNNEYQAAVNANTPSSVNPFATIVDIGMKSDNTTATTGDVISFVKSQVYNSPASPETGNITYDLIGAKIGIVQKLYHNSATPPAFPPDTVLVTGNYVPSTLNIIELDWVSGTRVEIRIAQG